MNEAAQDTTTETEWPKFGTGRQAPGAYTIDFSGVYKAPIRQNGQRSTFAEVYVKLKESKIVEMPAPFATDDKYITDSGEIDLDCAWQLAVTMRTLIDLTRQGINPYDVTWFYYDHDWSRDADESCMFFAVCNGKIVDESYHFSSEEPRILKRKESPEPLWHSHPYLAVAWEQYWYRKFYTETLTGQLMVLRPDEPILYHFERPTRDTLRDLEFVTLVKMYRLIWVAIPLLVAIVFPSIKLYMAGLAVLLVIDVLWRAWETRKLE